MTTERDPTEAAIHQVQGEAIPDVLEVPVRIIGPVDVRILPAVAWTVTRYSLSDTVGPIRAVGRNPFRKRLLLTTAGATTFLYGASNEQVRTRSTAGQGGSSNPVELFHTEEVWINNVATETPEVTVVEEMWTD